MIIGQAGPGPWSLDRKSLIGGFAVVPAPEKGFDFVRDLIPRGQLFEWIFFREVILVRSLIHVAAVPCRERLGEEPLDARLLFDGLPDLLVELIGGSFELVQVDFNFADGLEALEERIGSLGIRKR